MALQDISAALLILIGLWLLYRSRKRVFGRRNAFGIEQFSSYRAKVVAKVVDFGLMFVAALLMLTGIIFLAVEHQQTWGWIVLVPLVLFLVVGYIPRHRR